MGLSNEPHWFSDFVNKFIEFLTELLKCSAFLIGFIWDIWRKHQRNKKDKSEFQSLFYWILGFSLLLHF